MLDITVSLVSRLGTWQDVRDAARNTVSKKALGPGKEVTEQFKRKMLMSEHSPIRLLQFLVLVENLPSWVSVHLVRHGAGVEPFVSTQRDDRTGSVPRGDLPQGAPVRHMMAVNAQALINIARKRECFQASPETTFTVRRIQRLMREIGEPELADVMVPECVYRGFCPEEPCKSRYAWTPKFKRDVAAYRATIGRE